MSTTYHIVCRDCLVEYWFGQTSGAGPLRVYDGGTLGAFCREHLGHQLCTFIAGAEPDWLDRLVEDGVFLREWELVFEGMPQPAHD